MKFDWSEGALAEGIRLYQAGEFFAAHEAWESLWLVAQEPDKMFLQGLIQITAAFHHLRRQNPLGTARLLQAALEKLERYPAVFGSICVVLVCDDIRAWLQALEQGAQAPSSALCACVEALAERTKLHAGALRPVKVRFSLFRHYTFAPS